MINDEGFYLHFGISLRLKTRCCGAFVALFLTVKVLCFQSLEGLVASTHCD